MLSEIYEKLTQPILPDIKIRSSSQGLWWTCVTSDMGSGMAMTFQDRIGKAWENPENLNLHEVAQWIFDWDLRRCSFGMAAINAFWNSHDMIEKNFKGTIKYNSPGKNTLTEFVSKKLEADQTVVSVGHFPFLDNIVHENLHILEKKPQQTRDLPDTACEGVLPRADIALITGSSFVNKSLPRLLELAQNAHIMLLGPSTPLFPGLAQYGVKKIIGGGLIHGPDIVQSMVRNGAGGELFYSDAFSRLEIDLAGHSE